MIGPSQNEFSPRTRKWCEYWLKLWAVEVYSYAAKERPS
jgi:hypothetical protein